MRKLTTITIGETGFSQYHRPKPAGLLGLAAPRSTKRSLAET